MKKNLIIIMIMIILLSSLASAVLNDAELYVSFDDDDLSGSNPTDFSGNDYSITNNGATTGATGKINEAFSFDGSNDYLEVDTTGMPTTSEISVSVWQNLDSSAGTNNLIETAGSPSTARFNIHLPNSNGNVYWDFGDIGSGGRISKAYDGGTGSYNHWVFTSDGTNMKIYKNGSLWQSGGSGSQSIDLSAYNINIAKYTTNYMQGDYDEFGIWTRELTSDEVTTLYNNGSGYNPYAPEHQYFDITAKDYYSNFSLTNFTAFINGTEFNTTNGTINTGILSNSTGEYNISVISYEGAGYYERNYTEYNVSNDLIARLYVINSIKFNIYDLTPTLPSLMNQTVNITLKGDTITKTLIVENGTGLVTNLNTDTYKIIAKTSEYDDTIIYLTLTGYTHINLSMYMSKSKVEKEFITHDSSNNEVVSDVILTFTQNINGSYVTIGQLLTDFSGYGSIYLNPSTTYTFSAVHNDYDTFVGDVTPTQDSYTIDLRLIGGGTYESSLGKVTISKLFTRPINSSEANVTLTIFSLDDPGTLEFYGFNFTYRGTNYFVNQTGSVGGGIEERTINNINVSVQNNLTINWFYKVVDMDSQTFINYYYLNDVVSGITSLSGGLFDNISLGRPGKAILGMLILVMLFTIVYIPTKNMMVGSVTVMVGVGVLSIPSIGLFNLLYGSISFAALLIIIIGSSASGVVR